MAFSQDAEWEDEPSEAFAAAFEALESIEAELQCPVCLDTLADPHRLECGHIFCKGCIATAVSHAPACPVCKASAGRRQAHQDEFVAELVASVGGLREALGAGARGEVEEGGCSETQLEDDQPVRLAPPRPQPPHAGGELSAIAQRLPSNDKLREMALLSKEIDELDAAANARIAQDSPPTSRRCARGRRRRRRQAAEAEAAGGDEVEGGSGTPASGAAHDPGRSQDPAATQDSETTIGSERRGAADEVIVVDDDGDDADADADATAQEDEASPPVAVQPRHTVVVASTPDGDGSSAGDGGAASRSRRSRVVVTETQIPSSLPEDDDDDDEEEEEEEASEAAEAPQPYVTYAQDSAPSSEHAPAEAAGGGGGGGGGVQILETQLPHSLPGGDEDDDEDDDDEDDDDALVASRRIAAELGGETQAPPLCRWAGRRRWWRRPNL